MEASTFSGLKNILASTGTSATAWVGESGGAYNSGHHLVSDAFVYSFWLVANSLYSDIIKGSLELGSNMFSTQYLKILF